MLEWTDALLRLGAATLIGAVIGLDRDLHGKPTGVRTMGIVALGAAVIVLASQYPAHMADVAAGSRVMQGIITGIGFLGAGVILHKPDGGRVHGLTTAASIWLTACIGAACGAGAWPIVISASVLVAIVLGFGRTVEVAFERRFPRRGPEEKHGPQS
jgi:putative Mg2+ transporter-C (MgtC) family protein